MKTKLLPFLGGLVLGVALAIAGFLARRTAPAAPPAPEATTAEPVTPAPDPRDEALAAAHRKVASLEAVNLKLTSRLQAQLKKNAAPASASTTKSEDEDTGANPLAALAKVFGGDGGTNKMSEAMTGMMRSMLGGQVAARISLLKRRLDLTDEQERTLESILTRQTEASIEAGKKMLGGKLTGEEIAQLGDNARSPREEIQALLTPEQWEGYEAHEKEERQQQARAVASAELLQLQSHLGLDADQQDKVQAVLAEQALAQFTAGEQSTSSPTGGAGPMDFVRAQNERKQAALRSVLTPEQFDRYRKFQEQQLKLIEAFLPKGARGGAIDVNVIPVSPAP